VRSIGVTYNEANQLGCGLREANDGGLTLFGRRAVRRMNQLGILIDCSHCGDQTTLDTIAASERPIVLSHIGARALWDSNRMAPDNVLLACAAEGGVIGVEAAPHNHLQPADLTDDICIFQPDITECAGGSRLGGARQPHLGEGPVYGMTEFETKYDRTGFRIVPVESGRVTDLIDLVVFQPEAKTVADTRGTNIRGYREELFIVIIFRIISIFPP
jgi:hypothetical protein